MTGPGTPAKKFPQPANAPGWKQKPPPGGVFAVVVLAAGIAAALAPSEGGQRLDVYRDSAGILTACTGIIGPAVNAKGLGNKFTKAECDAMDQAYIAKMVPLLQRCVPIGVRRDMTYGEWVSYGHWAYNTGTASFCYSTLAKRLAAGDHAGACRQMAVWTWTPVRRGTTPAGRTNGKPQPALRQDCRDVRNKCNGIPARRDLEVSMCLSALN